MIRKNFKLLPVAKNKKNAPLKMQLGRYRFFLMPKNLEWNIYPFHWSLPVRIIRSGLSGALCFVM